LSVLRISFDIVKRKHIQPKGVGTHVLVTPRASQSWGSLDRKPPGCV